jgi:hypothetical protein
LPTNYDTTHLRAPAFSKIFRSYTLDPQNGKGKGMGKKGQDMGRKEGKEKTQRQEDRRNVCFRDLEG